MFTKLLPTGSVVDEHSFHLQKKDGSKTKVSYTFANLQIPWDDAVIPAGLAPSWAQQGIPMDAYAAEIVSRYRALAHTTPKG